MNCTRCEGTGFINWPEDFDLSNLEHNEILEWLGVRTEEYPDFQVCDCCGNGEDAWHGEPGQHYSSNDPIGKNGPYAYNGGLCECH